MGCRCNSQSLLRRALTQLLRPRFGSCLQPVSRTQMTLRQRGARRSDRGPSLNAMNILGALLGGCDLIVYERQSCKSAAALSWLHCPASFIRRSIQPGVARQERVAPTTARIPAQIASGSSDLAATMTAKSLSFLQMSQGKWWASERTAWPKQFGGFPLDRWRDGF